MYPPVLPQLDFFDPKVKAEYIKRLKGGTVENPLDDETGKIDLPSNQQEGHFGSRLRVTGKISDAKFDSYMLVHYTLWNSSALGEAKHGG